MQTAYKYGMFKADRVAVENHMEVRFMKYVCTVCGWVYDEDEAGTKWEDLPEDFVCELCGVGKDMFEAE